MTRRARLLRVLVAAVAGAGLLAAATGPAGASHESGETLHCGGEQFTMRPNSGNWGIRKVEDTSTKFVVVSYTVTVDVHEDDHEGYGPIGFVKGNGNAHKNQSTETCWFSEAHHGIVDPFTGEIVDATFTIELTVARRP